MEKVELTGALYSHQSYTLFSISHYASNGLPAVRNNFSDVVLVLEASQGKS